MWHSHVFISIYFPHRSRQLLFFQGSWTDAYLYSMVMRIDEDEFVCVWDLSHDGGHSKNFITFKVICNSRDKIVPFVYEALARRQNLASLLLFTAVFVANLFKTRLAQNYKVRWEEIDFFLCSPIFFTRKLGYWVYITWDEDERSVWRRRRWGDEKGRLLY